MSKPATPPRKRYVRATTWSRRLQHIAEQKPAEVKTLTTACRGWEAFDQARLDKAIEPYVRNKTMEPVDIRSLPPCRACSKVLAGMVVMITKQVTWDDLAAA